MVKNLFGVLAVCIILLGCLPIFSSFEPEPSINFTPTPRSPSKQVATTTLPLVERWRWSGIVPGLQYPPHIAATDERIIIAGYDGQEANVLVFDAHSGDLVWESDYIEHLNTLTVADNHIYVGTMRYAQAFDLETGEVLWQGAEQPWDKKGFLYVQPTEEQIHVYDFRESHLYVLNPQTGHILEEIDHSNILFKQGDIHYSGCGYGYQTSCLVSTGTKGNKTHWTQRFRGLIHLWPIFTEDRIILNAGGQLFALDSETGNIIWQSGPRFITGPAIQDSVIYAVRYDAAIVAFNLETGQEVGRVNMIPNRTIEDDGGYVVHYAIAASDKFVAVYYGNSNELIVFGK